MYTCDAMAGKELSTDMRGRKKAQKRISECRLIFTTCIGAGLGLLRDEEFGIAIVDEASQQTEPASLVPLIKGCQKVILVGDHVQLRATVQQHAVLQEYDVSLFERLYKREQQLSLPDTGLCKVMLDTQYRMHEDVCSFSSAEFYEKKLRTGVSPDERPLPLSEFPWPKPRAGGLSADQARMVFVQSSAVEDFGQRSKCNRGQADLCLVICKMLCASPPVPAGVTPSLSSSPPTSIPQQPISHQSIALLTPYTRQADLFRATLSSFKSVEISSIDGFQGREADIVIFATVRCNVHHEIGFLSDLRRLNVALTRARAAVIVVGDRDTLTKGTKDWESAAVWKRLLDGLVEVRLDVAEKKPVAVSVPAPARREGEGQTGKRNGKMKSKGRVTSSRAN
jgi:superfamily I DNA and/or RNA helicase